MDKQIKINVEYSELQLQLFINLLRIRDMHLYRHEIRYKINYEIVM